MEQEKLQRIVEMEPAYDKRDPDPSKNYGIHGVNLRMVLKGKKGAVQFLIYTGWHLPHVQEELDNKHQLDHLFHKPIPADVGYHSPKPIHGDYKPTSESCPYLDGKPCYCDGSALHAEKVFGILLEKGSDGVWGHLEDYYDRTFTQGE